MGRPTTCTFCKHSFQVEHLKEWKKDYSRCPKCKILYSNTTKTERKLMELQDIYLVNYSPYIFSLMYPILLDYSSSILKKKFISALKNASNPIDYFAKNAVVLLYMDYQKKKGKFKIKDSFGGYLFYKIRQSIHGIEERSVGVYTLPVKKEEWDLNNVNKNIKDSNINWNNSRKSSSILIPNVSLNYILPDGNEVECEDPYNVIHEVEYQYDIRLLLNKLFSSIKDIKNYCNSISENWFRLMGFLIFLEKGTEEADIFFDLYKRKGKIKFQNTRDFLYEELKNLGK